MNTLEDRIRTAVTQTAEEIAPGSIPPLSLGGLRPAAAAPGPSAAGKAGGR